HHIGGVVHNIGVVARAAVHAVGAGAAVQPIVADTSDQGVVAASTVERIVAAQTRQNVVGVVAHDIVTESIAGPVDGRSAAEGQLLHVRRQGVADRGHHLVRAGIDRFHHHIGGVVHNIGVVARAAVHAVGAGAAVQPIVADTSDQGVVAASTVERIVAAQTRQNVVGVVAHDIVTESIAGPVDGRSAAEGQLLHVRHQGVADQGHHVVGAGIDRFHHHIGGVVHNIGVVARAAVHAVGAGAAVQPIVADTSDQGVVAASTVERIVAAQTRQNVVGVVAHDIVTESIAGPVDGRSAAEGQLLHVRHQGVADQGHHVVGAGIDRFHHHIGGVVHNIGVVARAAVHAVGAGAAVQPIVADTSDQGVVAASTVERIVAAQTRQNVVGVVAHDIVTESIAGPVDGRSAAEGQLLHVRHQGVADQGHHVVGAGIDRFHHHIGGVVHNIGVVARAAVHAVGAGAAVQPIVADTSDQGVVAASTVERIVAAQTRQNVVGVVAHDIVTESIAGPVDGRSAAEGQLLHVRHQGVADQGHHVVGAGIDRFHHHIGGVVHNIGVVARAAVHAVGAGAAVQPIVADTSDQGVVAASTVERIVAAQTRQNVVGVVAHDIVTESIAGPVDGRSAAEGQLLHVRHQGVADQGHHVVGAGIDRFHHHIGGVVHNIGVVARAAVHAV